MNKCRKRQKVVKQGRVVLRCLNRECSKHGQRVDADTCASCPVRRVRHERPCERHKKEKQKSRGAPAPVVTEQDMVNVTDEEVAEMLEKDGMTVKDLENKGPDYPPLSMQLWAYKEALIKWQKAGRPTRSKEQIKQIHSQHCSKCDWYDKKKRRCKGCGCKVTEGDFAVVNKIKMATEHCPKGLW